MQIITVSSTAAMIDAGLVTGKIMVAIEHCSSMR